MYSTIVPVIVEAKKREEKATNYDKATITFSRRVTGWQYLTLTREKLEEIVRPSAEDDKDYEARLDGVWKLMVDKFNEDGDDEIELDEVSMDDIGLDADDIDTNDDDVVEWVETIEGVWDEENRKCVLTGETPKDWNAGDEIVETMIGPMRDIYADVLPKIVELLNKKDESKQKEKDKEIERLKAELKKTTEQLASIKKAIW
jgi:hypothetical protein